MQRTSVFTADDNAEIVIIGGGGAGLAAASAAADEGVKNIILMEAGSAPGGNAVFPEGIFAAGSYLQQRLGVEARPDELFKSAMSFAHWKTNPRLVRILVNKSGDTIHWLESKGVKFFSLILHYPNQTPAVFHTVKPPERTGAAVVKALRHHCESLGVRYFLKTQATSLLTDATDGVVGVAASRQGEDIKVRTKSVIIATGGFAGNSKLIKQYVPTFDDNEIRVVGIPHRGDGIQLATGAGAAVEGMVTLEMAGPVFAGPRSISPLVHRPNTIWVNKNGERFVDESVFFIFSEAANALWQQPGKISYTLFDEEIKQKIVGGGLDPHENITLGNISESWPAGLDNELRSQTEKGLVHIANSWGEIAERIAIPERQLINTVDVYNHDCDRGYDTAFVKDREYLNPLRTPPFYAVQCGIGLITTHGGIKINERTEVIGVNSKPIKGLYAAGVETGGTDSDTYNVILSGHSFGFTINTGRIAGEQAAGYVKRFSS